MNRGAEHLEEADRKKRRDVLLKNNELHDSEVLANADG